MKIHEAEVEAHPDHQVSLTDPDARSMMKAGGGSTVSYNVQTAVDSKHHLIAAHEVTNVPSDRSQLSSMAGKARSAFDTKTLTVIADPGYYKGEEIVACYDADITALVPKIDTSPSKAQSATRKPIFATMQRKPNIYVRPGNGSRTDSTVWNMARSCGCT